jgi:5-methylcytosine-specific restriction protein B
LITLIEKDKRGVTVRLAQSNEEFTVPSNVWIIGTMNTADRSVHLLDAALRRRFAFVELLPDSQALANATAGALALDLFLDALNQRVRTVAGRERQIGQALFYEDGTTIESAEQFAAIFRYELLPLLHEYVFEDYAALATILGNEIIDTDAERLTSVVEDPDTLCAALADEFGASASA